MTQIHELPDTHAAIELDDAGGDAFEERDVRGCVNLGKAMTRAGRSAASRRRKICACWIARRSAEKFSSASVIASTRMFSSHVEMSANRARQVTHLSR